LMPLPPMAANQGMFADAALAPDRDDDGDLIVMLRADLLHQSLSSLTLGATPAGAAAARTARPAPSKRVAAA
jgi:hypothetical protein